MYIDFACGKNCWNIIDSYCGMHCVCCGCCAKDKKTRYESRIRCLETWLKEQYEFDNWIPKWKEEQEKNRKANIRYFKRQLRYYKKQLALLMGEVKNDSCATFLPIQQV